MPSILLVLIASGVIVRSFLRPGTLTRMEQALSIAGLIGIALLLWRWAKWPLNPPIDPDQLEDLDCGHPEARRTPWEQRTGCCLSCHVLARRRATVNALAAGCLLVLYAAMSLSVIPILHRPIRHLSLTGPAGLFFVFVIMPALFVGWIWHHVKRIRYHRPGGEP